MLPGAVDAEGVFRSCLSSLRRAIRRLVPRAINRTPNHNNSIDTAPAANKVIGKTVSCSPVSYTHLTLPTSDLV